MKSRSNSNRSKTNLSKRSLFLWAESKRRKLLKKYKVKAKGKDYGKVIIKSKSLNQKCQVNLSHFICRFPVKYKKNGKILSKIRKKENLITKKPRWLRRLLGNLSYWTIFHFNSSKKQWAPNKNQINLTENKKYSLSYQQFCQIDQPKAAINMSKEISIA